MSKVRTNNIEIEGTYVQAIMNRYGVHTKTEAVASRHLAETNYLPMRIGSS